MNMRLQADHGFTDAFARLHLAGLLVPDPAPAAPKEPARRDEVPLSRWGE